MTTRKFLDPVCITVRMERVKWKVLRKKIVFQDEFDARIDERLPQILLEDSTRIDPRDIKELIRLQQEKIEEERQIAQMYLDAEKERKAKELQWKEQQLREEEAARAQDERDHKLIARKQLLELFHNLSQESRLFTEDEALSFDDRLVNADDGEEYPILQEMRGLVDERLPSLNGTGDQIRSILENDENPNELLEKAVSWIAMDARKARERRMW